MIRPRLSLVLCLLLGVSSITQSSVRAQPSAGTRFTSIRYGYALALPPGWSISKGDCAQYAVVATANTLSSIQIHVTKGALSSTLLRQAEDKTLRASGMVLGAVSHGTLRLRATTYQTARATVSLKHVTFGVLVAGLVRNQLTYIVVDMVRDPASRTGQQNAKTEQSIQASLTFVRPASAGSFSCVGNGVSRKLTAIPAPTARNTTTRTPVPTSTQTPAPTSTPPNSPTPTVTEIPLPAGIPTSGSTTNGCAITPAQAAGEAHLLALLNAERAAAGVAPLTLLPALSVVARDHSCDMNLHFNLSHTGTDGSDPLQRIRASGVTFTSAGENIGMQGGYGLIGDIDLQNQKMMAELLSPGTHRWNIMSPDFHQVGIGVIDVGGPVWLTEDFTG
ncbi:MAG: hypothetical protein JWO59_2938 [Chloroflexi bacterium]|nr:hypothetical protein [Chloroflexota bacterium]